MVTYFIYIIVALILLFVIHTAIKALNIGIKARNRNRSDEQRLNWKK